jgi:hypothetical protein
MVAQSITAEAIASTTKKRIAVVVDVVDDVSLASCVFRLSTVGSAPLSLRWIDITSEDVNNPCKFTKMRINHKSQSGK